MKRTGQQNTTKKLERFSFQYIFDCKKTDPYGQAMSNLLHVIDNVKHQIVHDPADYGQWTNFVHKLVFRGYRDKCHGQHKCVDA